VEKLIRLITMYRSVRCTAFKAASSLISAGFLPQAVEEGFAPERLRVQPRAGEEIAISRIATSETSRFLPSVFSSETQGRSVLSLAKFLERLSSLPNGIDPLPMFDRSRN
jgi:hypothetical protein